MSETFDAYHQWLGIPPNEQPPNHYRLLGIAAFESDANVISNAADRQMAHLQTFKTGRYSALSQQLLTEVAAARICLLNATKKTEYDAALRKKQGSATQPQHPVARPVVHETIPFASSPAEHAAPSTPRPRPILREEDESESTRYLWAALVPVALLVFALIWWIFSPSQSPRRPTPEPPSVTKRSDKTSPSSTASHRESAGDEPSGKTEPAAQRKGVATAKTGARLHRDSRVSQVALPRS